MKLGSLYFHYLQWVPLPSVASFKADLTDKNVIITGSNVGLGLEAARHLARMNPGKLILACRDVQKAESAKEEILKDTGCKSEAIECWKLDQADFSSVKAFADRFESEIGRLDLLIANAGMSNPSYTKTVDGWETVLQVNHLSTCLLSLRLLPCLEKAPVSPPTPRLVIVSSDVHYWVYELPEAKEPKILEVLGSEEHCIKEGVMRKRYSVSKLLNVFFTRELASRLRPTALTVNAVNPAMCQSELGRNRPPPGWRTQLYRFIFARSAELGSRTLLHAALAPDMQGQSGKFTNACAIAEESDLVLSDDGAKIQARVWDETIEILTKVDPKLQDILTKYLK